MHEDCLKCKKLGSPCDGPNFMAMDTADLIAWCNARRKQLPGMTYDKIVEETGLSKGTVSGFFGGTHSDYRLETIRPILRLLVGGEWGGSPCADPGDNERAAYEERIKQLEAEAKTSEEKMQLLAEENSRLQEHIKTENKQHQEQLKYLRGESKRKNKAVTILAVVAGIALLYIIITLIIDRSDPSRGFWWLESLLHLPNSIIGQPGVNA